MKCLNSLSYIASVAASALFLGMTTAATAADGRVFTSEKYRCSIALPGKNWRFVTAGDLVTAIGPDRRAGLSMVETEDTDVLSAEWRAAFDKQLTSIGSGQKISSRDFQIDGRAAYRVIWTATEQGIKTSSVTVVLASRNIVYSISGYSSKTDADTDPQINAFINSFQLLDPPDKSTPRPANANQRGWLDGLRQNAGVLVASVLFVGLFIWLVRKMVKS